MRKEEEIAKSRALKRRFIVWNWVRRDKKHRKRGTDANLTKFYEIARSDSNFRRKLNWKVLKRINCLVGVRGKVSNSRIKSLEWGRKALNLNWSGWRSKGKTN